MKQLTVKFKHLPLQMVLLLLWFDRCESLTDNSLPSIFFPFGTDQGDSVVAVGSRNCDGPVNIPYEIFNYRTLYVCTAGLVSFGSSITSTSGSIPRGRGPPFIAVNWYDFTTYISTEGRVYYRSASQDTRSTLLNTTDQTVQQALSREGFSNFRSRWALVVTWHDVSIYESSRDRNTFQLVLTTDAQRHVMLFHYGRIDNLGTVGYDSRDGFNYYRLPDNYDRNHTNIGFRGRLVLRANRLSVRLAGSGETYKGRLEVMYNGVWGTVCDDGFSDIDATVFCYHLDFGYHGQFIGNTYRGNDSQPIWLNDVECTGNETDVMQCRHAGWGIHNCTHSQDVSISCYFVSANADPGLYLMIIIIVAMVCIVIIVLIISVVKCVVRGSRNAATDYQTPMQELHIRQPETTTKVDAATSA